MMAHHCDALTVDSKDSHLSWRKNRKIEINEWTFSLLLFLLSLTIVVGKFAIHYGDALPPMLNDKLTHFSNVNNYFSHLPNSSILSKALTFDHESEKKTGNITNNVVTVVYNDFGWLINAILTGLGTLLITWFIIYKDSSIPGVNPPSPFSPTKNKRSQDSRIQMNYLIGIVNGLLMFIYMCLE